MSVVTKKQLINDAKSSKFNNFVQNTKMIYDVKMNIADGTINVEVDHPDDKLILQFDEKSGNYKGEMIKS